MLSVRPERFEEASILVMECLNPRIYSRYLNHSTRALARFQSYKLSIDYKEYGEPPT